MTYFLTVHKNRRASSIKRMIIRRKQGREEKREMAASKSVINVAALCGSLCAAPSARLPSTAASSATVLFSSFILFPLNFSMYVMSIGELGFDFGCSDEAFQGSN